MKLWPFGLATLALLVWLARREKQAIVDYLREYGGI